METYRLYAEEITDAPPLFHKYTALSIAATAIGNRVFFRFGDVLLRPNLWLCLVAPSSVGRKSTSLGIGRRVLADAIPSRALPSEFSSESLLRELSDSAQGCIFASEFLSLVGLMAKGYNEGLMGLMADLYDCPPEYTRKLMSTTYVVRNPAVNILAATTVEWFLEKLKPEDWAGGFVPRFMLVPSLDPLRKLMPLPPPADEQKRRVLAGHLVQFSRCHGELVLSDGAREFYEEWYGRHLSNISLPPMFHGSYHRMAIQAIKLAMVSAVMRSRSLAGKGFLLHSDIEFGCSCIDELCQALSSLASGHIGFTRHEKRRIKILDYLRGLGGECHHSKLLKFSGLTAKEFGDLIGTLEQEGAISTQWVSTGTKKKRVYRLLEEEE